MIYKRVMLLSHEMTYTGAPNSLLNVAVTLRKNGHKVSVFTLKDGAFSKEYAKKGFRIRLLHEAQINYPFLSAFDLAIANTIFCGKYALKIQKYIPTVLYIREAQNLPQIIENCGLSDDYINHAENIICVSEYAEEFIKKNYSVQRIRVLHNFLNVSIFYRPKKNISADGKVHFLISGTIEKRKGQDIALEAMRLLPRDIFDKAILHIAGRKPEWSRDYWEELDIENQPNVIYHGEITSKKEMSHLYDRVNVVIVPSLDESCSLAAVEGVMHGRALIVSENVGAKYLIKGNGFTVKTSSGESLAEAMSFCVKHFSELKTMGENSYKNFFGTSTEKDYYTNLLKVIKSIGR